MTALLENLDLTALLEYIDLLNRYSRGPSWGLLGPLSGWDPGQNAPVAPPPPPPLWAALHAGVGESSMIIVITTTLAEAMPTGNDQCQCIHPNSYWHLSLSNEFG